MKKFQPGIFNLSVKRSRSGLGLFTQSPIKKGSCIIEYTGRKIGTAEQYASRSKYLFEINNRITIDGASRSNTARYINHSCSPNCEIEVWGKRVWVMARRAIKPGEELGYDYGKEYFDEYIKPKGCRCISCTKKAS